MICPWILPAKYIFFTPETSALIYYSHITSLVVSVIILLLIIFFGNKSSSRNFLSLLIISFITWVIFNLFLWTNNDSQLIIFLWSFFGLLTSLISVFCYWLYRSFVLEKKNDWQHILLPIITLVPIIFITPTKLNLQNFDLDICGIANNATEGSFPYYYYSVAFLFFFLILINFISNFKKILAEKKKQTLIFSLGIILFMLSFFTASFFASYLAKIGFIQDFGLEQYGLFGMTVFMAVITFLIVKFKAFDIKLLWAQALVWSLIITIGSEFFFAETTINRILISVTLLISTVIGYNIIQGVKREISLRENLQIANQNQEALIHFITHQLKGFFTKSKMIFAGILDGDFGEASDEIKDLAKTGLASDNNAVSMIQDILGASNLKTGTTEYNFKKVDLTQLIKKIAISFTESMMVKGLRFDNQIPDTPLYIMADETQISQVFTNIIDNSIRYTPAGDIKLSLNVSPQDKSKVIFALKDTGIGLSDSDKRKLFTEGGKGDEALKVNVNSTGFGLYIVKKITESHHGRIWAESAGRGHGSEFYVELGLVE